MLRWHFTQTLFVSAALGLGSAAAAQTLPIADAGPDQIIDCAPPEGVDVTLDGSASSDPDDPNAVLTFSWTSPSLAVPATGEMPVVSLLPGVHVITLVVDDGVDGASTNVDDQSMVTITINADVTPPDLVLSDDAHELWPPNHKLHGYVAADLVESVSDDCVELSEDDVVFGHATSDESDNHLGDGNTKSDVQFADDCHEVDVRSERSGKGDGRVYEITLRVDDGAGNSDEEVFTVSVPHDAAHSATDSGDEAEYESECGEGSGLTACPAAPTPTCTAAGAGETELGSGPKGASLRWRSSGFAAGSVDDDDNAVCAFVDGAAAGGTLSPDKVKVRGKKGQGALDVASRGNDLELPTLPLASGALLRLELHDGSGDCVSFEEEAE